MALDLNKIHHCDNRIGMIQLPEKCAQLIIADPPYFRVKGDFDFEFASFEEYQEFIRQQAIAYKRILADNGTLFIWGHAKYIAYVQVIFDQYFQFENSLIWRKTDSMQYQYYSPDLARTFNTHNERLLMYSSVDEPESPIAKYLKDEFTKAKISNREIAKLFPSKTGGLTGCVSNWLNGDNVITEEQYLKIKDYLKNEYLAKSYKDLRTEYDKERRFFYNNLKFEEVLEFSQESNISKNYKHDTIKPEKLTRALIITCSRKNDLVVVPFAGSGTECAMSKKEGRNFIGFEKKVEYVEMSNYRVKCVYPQLF